MKPTKMRNAQIWQATNGRRSRQLGSLLSKDLRAKYGRRSIRVSAGDTVRVMRGEYKDVDGKVAMVDTAKSGVAIEGIKREKGKGDKVDIIIHASNILVTGINTQDKWRTSRLSGSKGVRSTPAKAGAAAGQAEKPAKEAAGHSEKPAKAADAGQAEKPAKEAAGHSEKPAKAADAGQAEKPAKGEAAE